MKVAIHQPQYFPYPGFFHKLSMADILVIMDDTQYDKRFTNRNKIASTDGFIWLSVPINKDHKFLPNRLVEINNNIPWKEEHWKKIQRVYANSNFFNLYKEYFQKIYNKEWQFLCELDITTLVQTIEWLGIKIKILKETDLNIKEKGTERLLEVCNEVGADTYISGRGLPGKEYMDEKLFEKSNIKLLYQNYKSVTYPQYMSKSFKPDLSIIDLLFNVGPESMSLITSQQLNN